MKIAGIIFIVVILISCTKENSDYKSLGTITGADPTMCACCGGWFINIENTQYRIVSMPENFAQELAKETFPVTVKLDWQLITTGCPSEFKRITALRIRKI
jgi:hypothetical protein